MSIYTKLDIPSGFLFKRLYVLKSASANCVLNLRTMSSHFSFSFILSFLHLFRDLSLRRMHTHHTLCLLKHRTAFPTSHFTFTFLLGKVLRLEEREMPCRLAVAHDKETDDDKDPIHVVGDDGPVGCGVLPP